nr:YihY/virulence factor BrkB family protein [Parachlamydiaceae bacterium]
ALYLVMPNTRVPVWCAALAGVLAGTSFQIVQWLYINFQLGITSYGPIYGSFAALPLLILWINISWLITLAGAEIAYHAENDIAISRSETNKEHRKIDECTLGLSVVEHCVEAFCNNSPPLTVYDVARATGVNVVTARNVVEQLKSEGILSEVRWGSSSEIAYQPGRDIKNITVQMVCNALNSSRRIHYKAIWDEHVQRFQKKLGILDKLVEESPENILFVNKDVDDHA